METEPQGSRIITGRHPWLRLRAGEISIEEYNEAVNYETKSSAVAEIAAEGNIAEKQSIKSRLAKFGRALVASVSGEV